MVGAAAAADDAQVRQALPQLAVAPRQVDRVAGVSTVKPTAAGMSAARAARTIPVASVAVIVSSTR